jgi:hypothetical protein
VKNLNCFATCDTRTVTERNVFRMVLACKVELIIKEPANEVAKIEVWATDELRKGSKVPGIAAFFKKNSVETNGR